MSRPSLSFLAQPLAAITPLETFMAGEPITIAVPYNTSITDTVSRGGQKTPRRGIPEISPPRRGAATLTARYFAHNEFVYNIRAVVREMGMLGYRPADAWATSIVCTRYPLLQLTAPVVAAGTEIPRRLGEPSHWYFCWGWSGFLEPVRARLGSRPNTHLRTAAVEQVPDYGGWEPRFGFIGTKDRQ